VPSRAWSPLRKALGLTIPLSLLLPTKPPRPFRRLPAHLRAPMSADRPDRARGQPGVDVEPHAWPPAVVSPDRFRPQPPEAAEACERPLHDPGLRETRPLVLCARTIARPPARPVIATTGNAARSWTNALRARLIDPAWTSPVISGSLNCHGAHSTPL
jgi:hypothetical protein